MVSWDVRVSIILVFCVIPMPSIYWLGLYPLRRMPFKDARRYLSSRWDVWRSEWTLCPASLRTHACWCTLIQACEVPVGDGWGPALASRTSGSKVAVEAPLAPWHEEALGEKPKASASALSRWFGVALGLPELGPSLATIRLWDAAGHCDSTSSAPEPWAPWKPKVPGDVLHVHETGWGAVPEVFRAFAAWRKRRSPPKPKKSKAKAPRTSENPKAIELRPLGPLVILRFLKRLLQDEVLAFPHSFQEPSEGQTFHLVALVCQSTRREAEAVAAALPEAETKRSAWAVSRPRSITFLHGAKEWLVDGSAQMHEIQRWQLPGSAPNAWLCTRDLSPQLAVYSTEALGLI